MSEEGGAGTVYVHATDTDNRSTSYLHLKNRGIPPHSTYKTDSQHGSGRTDFASEDIAPLTFDHLMIDGAVQLTAAADSEMVFGHIHGDNTGFLHVASHFTAEQADVPFPVAFRVYSGGRLSLPKGMLCIQTH